jgi:large subunit ribosomal protein L19
MTTKTEKFNQSFLKKLPDIRPGDTVKVYQKIKIGKQERIQIFEGQVLVRKHGKGISSTITVRKVISGIGVEKIFPLHSPIIEKIEIVKRGKVKRAKLYYLRKAKGKKARLKRVELKEKSPEKPKEKMEKPKEETKEPEKAKEAEKN